MVDRAGGTFDELRDRLKVVVDAELNLLAGDGFLGREAVDLFADAVDDDPAHAVGALQDVVIFALEAGFADEIAGAELAVAVFDLIFADFTDVAAGVRHEAVG